MAQSYQVKAGDTLSAIGKKFGVDYNKITGYASGNPNVIKTGEVLTIPDATPTPATPVIPASPAPAAGGAYTYQGKSYAVGTGPMASDPNAASKSFPGGYTGEVVPQAPKLPPAESAISVGKQYIDSRVQRGMPADEQSVVDDYNNSGLRKTYGDWKGSTTQYNAMIQWEDAQAKAANIKKQITDTGIQDNQGKTIVPPVEKTPSATPELGTAATGGEVNSTYPYSKMSNVDFNATMDSIVSKIGTTDLAKLISDFSGGNLTTPELEVNKEQRDKALADLKTKAAGALSTLQQNLASKGMTFSGIRTEAEAAQAAQLLSDQAGIGSEFALKIINAARDEQGRRETALKVAETNYNSSLKDLGYAYNPFTDTVEPTLEARKATTPKQVNVGGVLYEYDPTTGALTQLTEKAASATKIVNAGGNLFEYDPNTGSMNMVYEAPAKEKNLNISYQTDAEGNVTKIVTDPTSGSTVRTEDLGKLGKPSSAGGGEEFTQTQMNKGAATASVPLDTFKGYDYETKNYLINRASDFSGFKSDMLDTKQDPGRAAYTKDELLSSINDSSAPQTVKDMWTQYYYTLWPKTNEGFWNGFTDLWGLLG